MPDRSGFHARQTQARIARRAPVTSDEMLRAMPTPDLLRLVRNELTLSPQADLTVENAIETLSRQARLHIALIAALAGRG